MEITYSVPNADAIDVVVTNDKKVAEQLIERQYTLFTVPQMFGEETGAITLYLEREAQNRPPKPVSRADAHRVLQDYETSSRERCSFQ